MSMNSEHYIAVFENQVKLEFSNFVNFVNSVNNGGDTPRVSHSITGNVTTKTDVQLATWR
jgi:hypothetical protein